MKFSLSKNSNEVMEITYATDGSSFGTLRFPPEKLIEIRPHLQRLVEETYKTDECIAYDVAEDPFELGLIRFSEL